MKRKKLKILDYFCIMIMIFTTVFSNLTPVFSANGYTVINSQSLLETNTLDTLELNYTSRPTVTVSGSEPYTITDDVTFDGSNIRKIQFPNATSGKNLNSVVTVKFNNCGKLNNKSIDMKLVYSDIVTKGNNPMLYWSAYGKNMATNNEWWYSNIEHVTVKIYFYYSGSNTPIPLNTAYLSLFSEDRNEGASSNMSTNQYLYEKTYLEYLSSTSSTTVSRIYKNVFRGTVGSEVGGNTEAGTAKCVSFQYKNTNNIQVELYSLGNKVDVRLSSSI